MEYSRIGKIILTIPMLILLFALVIALYNAGFDVEAATMPENPTDPLDEALTSLLQADRPLITGNAVENDPGAGTVTLKGSVGNPTAYPLTVQQIEYRIPGEDGGLIASLAMPVIVPPGEDVSVELTGSATPDTLIALKSGSMEGTLFSETEIMGVRIITEMARPWEVEA